MCVGLGVAAVGCGDDAGVDADADADAGVTDAADAEADGEGSGGLPEAVCTNGTAYAAGTSVFREVTSEWGLDGVAGTRLSVGDVDSDGYPDLFVRRGGTRSNDWGPEGARHAWLLLNGASADGVPVFEDITASSLIDAPRIQAANTLGRPLEIVAFGDVDNDGDQDIYTAATTVDLDVSRGETSELMRNNGDNTFDLATASNPLRRQDAFDVPAGASFVDANRDGFLDLWVPQHNYEPPGGGIAFSQDLFYAGNGSSTFEDATAAMGLTTADWDSIDDINGGLAHTRAWSGVACDLNDDGTPELMAASYGRAPNHLWQGTRAADGSVQFSNRSVASGYAYDDDLSWEDNQFARCYCESVPDAEGCADVPAPLVTCQANWQHSQDREPFRLGGNSGATVCADINNDGHLDLLTTEIKHWWAGGGADGSDILLNTGAADVAFDRTDRAQTGFEVPHPTDPNWDEGHMSATILDFDNDGWPDVYVGASDYPGNFGLLYRQTAPGTFERVPVGDGFEHNRSHGVVAADFDRDGDLDLIVGHSRSRCDAASPNNCYETQQIRAFENTLGDGGNWLQITLEGGAGTNRSAIGARVEVTAGGVTQTQEVGGGYGHYGAQNDMTLHFGLGTACDAQVVVRWPNAELTEQTLELVSGYRYAVVQGEAPVAVVR